MNYDSTVYDNLNELKKADPKLAQDLIEYEERFGKYKNKEWRNQL